MGQGAQDLLRPSGNVRLGHSGGVQPGGSAPSAAKCRASMRWSETLDPALPECLQHRHGSPVALRSGLVWAPKWGCARLVLADPCLTGSPIGWFPHGDFEVQQTLEGGAQVAEQAGVRGLGQRWPHGR